MKIHIFFISTAKIPLVHTVALDLTNTILTRWTDFSNLQLNTMYIRLLVTLALLLSTQAAVISQVTPARSFEISVSYKPTNISVFTTANPEYKEITDAILKDNAGISKSDLKTGLKILNGKGGYYQFKLVTPPHNFSHVLVFKVQGKIKILTYKFPDFILDDPSSERIGFLWGLPARYVCPVDLTGFKLFTDYDNSSFQQALNQTWKQNNAIIVDCYLLSVELLVSSSFYYFRFLFVSPKISFQVNPSIPIEIITCTAFQEKPAAALKLSVLKSSADLAAKQNVELPVDLSQTDVYGPALSKLFEKQPNLLNCQLINVISEQKSKFKFILQHKQIYDFLQQVYSVTVNPNKSVDIEPLWKNTAPNYGYDVISRVNSLCLEKWPALKNMKLIEISNVRIDFPYFSTAFGLKREGLMLFYANSSTNSTVEFDISEGKETFIIY